MGFKNDSTLVFNKYRVIFDPPLDGVGLKLFVEISERKIITEFKNDFLKVVFNKSCLLLKKLNIIFKEDEFTC